MNSRQLFHEIMFYGNFDRMPVWHWAGWPETEERWANEGLPRNADRHQFFRIIGVDSSGRCCFTATIDIQKRVRDRVLGENSVSMYVRSVI